MDMHMATPGLHAALNCLAMRGASLRDALRYDWPRQADEAVAALRWCAPPPGAAGQGTGQLSLVGIVGGASSGKSTVFNNLLGGRLASRVTARGHATLGPIAAVHEDR